MDFFTHLLVSAKLGKWVIQESLFNVDEHVGMCRGLNMRLQESVQTRHVLTGMERKVSPCYCGARGL